LCAGEAAHRAVKAAKRADPEGRAQPTVARALHSAPHTHAHAHAHVHMHMHMHMCTCTCTCNMHMHMSCACATCACACAFACACACACVCACGPSHIDLLQVGAISGGSRPAFRPVGRNNGTQGQRRRRSFARMPAHPKVTKDPGTRAPWVRPPSPPAAPHRDRGRPM
jgi:hypothetical protein